MDSREAFFKYQAQTTDFSAAFEVDYARGSYIFGKDGKRYLDLVAGVSACNVGHSHPHLVKAVEDQLHRHTHVMVYGEYVQDKPLELARKIAAITPEPLESTYLVNSGTEAIEGALKLAKRYTGRHEIISARHSYHGSTHGSLSVSGYPEFQKAYRPLLPGIRWIRFNHEEDLEKISCRTAAVILETIQGAAGFIVPNASYLQQVSARCKEVGALLILDEIQPGIGRTGRWFGFDHFGVVPDILVTGKALGGGFSIGAFTSRTEVMDVLRRNPKLGHITTFGGHPIPAAAALANLEIIENEQLMESIPEKEALIRSLLVHPQIESITGMGLMLAVHLDSPQRVQKVAREAMKRGAILFWLLYKGSALRITPPLTISLDELRAGCRIILESLDAAYGPVSPTVPAQS